MADDRARGLMIGLAVGNLLGITTEGWSRVDRSPGPFPGAWRISLHGPGIPTTTTWRRRSSLPKRQRQGDGLDVDDLGRRFWRWAEVNGAGMGGLTGTVLSLHGGDYPQRLARNRLTGEPRTPDDMPIIEASRRGLEGRSRRERSADAHGAPVDPLA